MQKLTNHTAAQSTPRDSACRAATPAPWCSAPQLFASFFVNEEISESLKSAYKLATKNAKEDLDSQLKKLYKEMLALKKEMNAKSKNRDNRSG